MTPAAAAQMLLKLFGGRQQKQLAQAGAMPGALTPADFAALAEAQRTAARAAAMAPPVAAAAPKVPVALLPPPPHVVEALPVRTPRTAAEFVHQSGTPGHRWQMEERARLAAASAAGHQLPGQNSPEEIAAAEARDRERWAREHNEAQAKADARTLAMRQAAVEKTNALTARQNALAPAAVPLTAGLPVGAVPGGAASAVPLQHTAVIDNLRREQEELKNAREAAESLAKVYGSPAGQSMLKERLRLLAAARAEEEKAARAKRRGEVGPVAEGFENAAKQLAKMQDSLNSIAGVAGGVFAGLSAGILGFGTVADGGMVASATLKEHLLMLAGAVGEAFLPVIMQAAGWIEKATGWVENLDSGVKGNIARWISWTTVGAGAVMVLAKIGSAVAGTIGQFSRFGAWLTGGALAANPWIAALLGLAVAVSAAAAAFAYLKGSADEAGDAIEGAGKKKAPTTKEALGERVEERKRKEAEEKRKRQEEALSPEELEVLSPEERKRVREKKSPEDMLGELRKIEAEAQRALEKAQEKRLGQMPQFQGEKGEPLREERKRREEYEEKTLEAPGVVEGLQEYVDRWWEADKKAKAVLKTMLKDFGIDMSEEEFRGTPAKKLLEKIMEKANAPVEASDERLKRIQGILKKAPGEKPEGIEGGPSSIALRGLPMPTLSEAAAYSERIAIASLTGESQGDATAQRQLKELERANELLDGVGGLLKRVDESIGKINMPWGS